MKARVVMPDPDEWESQQNLKILLVHLLPFWQTVRYFPSSVAPFDVPFEYFCTTFLWVLKI
jgi:hypothetical protein